MRQYKKKDVGEGRGVRETKKKEKQCVWWERQTRAHKHIQKKPESLHSRMLWTLPVCETERETLTIGSLGCSRSSWLYSFLSQKPRFSIKLLLCSFPNSVKCKIRNNESWSMESVWWRIEMEIGSFISDWQQPGTSGDLNRATAAGIEAGCCGSLSTAHTQKTKRCRQREKKGSWKRVKLIKKAGEVGGISKKNCRRCKAV